MKKSDVSSILAVAASALAVGLVVMDPPAIIGQAPPKGPDKGAPAKGGKADAPGPVPRTADGKPDFSGFWNYGQPSGNIDIEPAAAKGGGKGAPGGGKGGPPPAADGKGGPPPVAGGAPPPPGAAAAKAKAKTAIVDPADGRVPYNAAARAYSNNIIANGMFKEPELHCYPSGVPHNMWVQFGSQWLQTPQYLVIAWEFMHSRRIIPLDGRPHQLPASHRQVQGESVGKWEGDTLVIETKNLTKFSWLDTSGHHAPEDAHVIERLTMTNANTIAYEATVTSARDFTQPMKVEGTITRAQGNNPAYEQMEFACIEGNRDLEHYTEDKGGKAKNIGIRQP